MCDRSSGAEHPADNGKADGSNPSGRIFKARQDAELTEHRHDLVAQQQSTALSRQRLPVQVRSGSLSTRSRTERHPASNRADGGSSPPGLACSRNFEGPSARDGHTRHGPVHRCGVAQGKSGGLISRTDVGSSPTAAIRSRIAPQLSGKSSCFTHSWPRVRVPPGRLRSTDRP